MVSMGSLGQSLQLSEREWGGSSLGEANHVVSIKSPSDEEAQGSLTQRPILFVTRSLRIGGAEKQLALTCRELKKSGLPTKIISFYRGGPLEEQLREEALPIAVLGKKGRWDVFPFLKKAFREMTKENPLLIYSFLGGANIVCALFKLLRPRVKLIWSIRASRMDLTLYDPIWRMEKALLRLLSFVPERIVANSEAGLCELMRQGYAISKLRVIHNGIDTLRFHPSREEGTELRKKWAGENPHAKLIGIVARLDPIKDHETFLRAASILIRKRAGVRFVCVGPDWGERSKKLRGIAADLGIGQHVIWEGEREDMNRVYNALDLLTLCSTSEGFPNAVGEAMACGIPCVVTDVGDCARLVGDTGKVVPKKNPTALALAWVEMLENDLHEMGKMARARILENFSSEKMIRKTMDLFIELLGPKLSKQVESSFPCAE